jgi:tRNA threonylcarbamoyl adenosine modification protein (Sua5/YciO/YrdC/YwlC family)
MDRPAVVALAGGAGGLGEVARQVAGARSSGAVVVLPTDTVYGLAALPADRSATDRLFDLKGRSASTPLAVLGAEVEQLMELVEPGAGAAAGQAAARFWPGPLTLVLPRRPGVELHLGEPVDTIGLRLPDHALVREVARLVGPIAATSANRHGEAPVTTAAAAIEALGAGLALVVDGGTLPVTASTVVDTTSRPWRTLREGPIPSVDVLALAPPS